MLYLILTYLRDLFRPRQDLFLENLALRQQILVLERQVNKPRWSWKSRPKDPGRPKVPKHNSWVHDQEAGAAESVLEDIPQESSQRNLRHRFSDGPHGNIPDPVCVHRTVSPDSPGALCISMCVSTTWSFSMKGMPAESSGRFFNVTTMTGPIRAWDKNPPTGKKIEPPNKGMVNSRLKRWWPASPVLPLSCLN